MTLKVADTVTALPGIVKVRVLPLPPSVTELLAASTTLTVPTSYPAEGVSVSVTVLPSSCLLGLAVTVPPVRLEGRLTANFSTVAASVVYVMRSIVYMPSVSINKPCVWKTLTVVAVHTNSKYSLLKE